MSLLKATDIRKSFSGREVLRGLDLSVEEGEVVAVIGPSGSGKSTLLRCLTGLETPDSGTIEIKGTTGLVFQQFNLFPHWSVLRNLVDPQVVVQKKPREEAEKFAMSLLARMDLTEKADEYPYQLSGGQQQRVAIARAMAMSPNVLFFDEPTSALDPELTAEILKVIRKLAEENMTMVIVTHEMGFARGIADKVYFMEGGVWLAQGTPQQIMEESGNERIRSFMNLIEQKE